MVSARSRTPIGESVGDAEPAGAVVVRPAFGDDLDLVVEVLTEAFLVEDVVAWLVPPVVDRPTVIAAYLRLQIEHVRGRGWISVTGAGDGAAVWYPVGRSIDEVAIPGFDRLLTEACGPYTDRFATWYHATRRRHPREIPHHYLALLGVRPDADYTRVAGALLAKHLGVLDAADLHGYAEASHRQAYALYQSHGFRPRGSYAVHHSAAGLRRFPMWRTPIPTPPPGWDGPFPHV